MVELIALGNLNVKMHRNDRINDLTVEREAREAARRTSRANSSMKSKAALKSSEADSRSADRTFSRGQPWEPLLEGGTMPPEWEARRSLAGAFYIKIDSIEPDPEQPRHIMDEGALRELAILI